MGMDVLLYLCAIALVDDEESFLFIVELGLDGGLGGEDVPPFGEDFLAVVFPYFLFRLVLAELKIFDSFQYLVIEFLFYDFPFYYCVRVERLVVEDEIVDLVDFIPCLFLLLFLLFLSSLLLLDLVEGCAHCEVDFPEDSFEEIGHDCNNDKVHEDKESDDVTILLLSSIAIAPGVDGPAALGENLHHKVL